MKKIILFLVIALFSGCSNTVEPPLIKELKIIGDLEHSLSIHMDDLSEHTISDNKHLAISLQDVFENNEIKVEEYNVMFVANDTLTNLIESDYDEVLVYVKDNKWHIHSDVFPPTLNLKDVNHLMFIKKQPTADDGVTLFSVSEDKYLITVGNHMSYGFETVLKLDGVSTKNTQTMHAYQQKTILPLSKLSDATSFLVFSYQGDHQYLSNDIYLLKKDTNFDVVDEDFNILVSHVAGILEDPPAHSIMDLYYDSEYYISNNVPIMIILVDGLGYHQFMYAKNNNIAPTITSLEPKIATSVYTPVTNAGMAAMLSGQSPLNNGVLNRRFRQVKTPTIFDVAKQYNASAVLLEGNINILDLNVDVRLHLDNNGNGTSDDEIFDSALQRMNDDDVLMIHFHSFDDAGHSYGPLASQTMNRLSMLDDMISELLKSWQGVSIIVSDHGMHQTSEGGNHGLISHSDMIVPYFIIP